MNRVFVLLWIFSASMRLAFGEPIKAASQAHVEPRKIRIQIVSIDQRQFGKRIGCFSCPPQSPSEPKDEFQLGQISRLPVELRWGAKQGHLQILSEFDMESTTNDFHAEKTAKTADADFIGLRLDVEWRQEEADRMFIGAKVDLGLPVVAGSGGAKHFKFQGSNSLARDRSLALSFPTSLNSTQTDSKAMLEIPEILGLSRFFISPPPAKDQVFFLFMTPIQNPENKKEKRRFTLPQNGK